MIKAYFKNSLATPVAITNENKMLLKEAIWVDMLSVSKDEEVFLEEVLEIDIPTKEEMSEIELSSRLYREGDIFYMTATMLSQGETQRAHYDAVTFILTPQQLITVRYIEPQAFKLFALNIIKMKNISTISLFVALLDSSVDRLADILEVIGHRLDTFSKTIFQIAPANETIKLDHQILLQQIGTNNDINTKARESLLGFNRLIAFFTHSKDIELDNNMAHYFKTLTNDITALSDHANFLSNQVVFLLDATLGFVSIEQNKIIKIFSVAAVIFLPPTLIASIYGMNFKFMPELSWHGGYFFALGMMMLSAWLPYKFFKRKHWL